MTDRGVAKEDANHHCTAATMRRRRKEALINCGRHTQDAINTTNHWLSSRRATYRKFGRRSSIGSYSMHEGTSPG